MKQLLTSDIENVSIADFYQCCEYHANDNLLISPTLKLTNLAGQSGNYTARIIIDDIVLVPERAIYVQDANNIQLSGRPISLASGSILKILIKGTTSDLTSTIKLILFNVVPVDAQEFVDISIPQINDAIKQYIPTLTITVNNDRVILAPKNQLVKNTLTPKSQQQIKNTLLPIRN